MELVHVGWVIHTNSHEPLKVQPEPGVRRKGKETNLTVTGWGRGQSHHPAWHLEASAYQVIMKVLFAKVGDRTNVLNSS